MIVTRKNLEKLLLLVKNIVKEPENKWFLDELMKSAMPVEERLTIVPVTEKIASEGVWESKIDKMEEHLKIDGFELIDYSDIADPQLKVQLTTDCIEMSRHRLGKLKEGVSYEEFCRFAFYQIEGLMNYFFEHKYEDLDSAKEGILSVVQREDIKRSIEQTETLGQISFYNKFDAFCSLYVPNNNYKRIINVDLRKLRNSVSHRSEKISRMEDDTLALAETLLAKDNSQMTQKDWRIVGEANQIRFKRKKDFNTVLDALLQFKTDVLKSLK